MTGKELRNSLVAWIKHVLITEQELANIKVITSHQDTPSPSKEYIVVPYNIGRTPTGRASQTETDNTGTAELVSDWQGTIEIREVNGEGDSLLELIKSLDRSDILDEYFREKGLVHYTSGNIQPIPQLIQERWNRQSLVEITIGLAETTTQNTSWIETVEYDGKIGEEEINNE